METQSCKLPSSAVLFDTAAPCISNIGEDIHEIPSSSSLVSPLRRYF
jgi:hypothetical protein